MIHAIVVLAGEIDDGAPAPSGHDWLIGTVLVAAIGLISTLATVLVGWWLKRDTRATREQAENSHAETEFPNLRDEVTEIRRLTQAVVGGLDDVKAGQRRHDKEIGGLRRDIGRTQDADARLEQRLDGHVEETRREHTALVHRLDIHLVQSDADRAELRQIAERIERHHPD